MFLGRNTILCLAAVATLQPAQAATVIASTTFNGQTINGATASNLNWSLNGVSDPGNLTALLQTGPGTQSLFTSTFASDKFIPALNTGNGNTFWTTNVPLTVTATAFGS